MVKNKMFFSRSGCFRVPEPSHDVVLRYWQQGVSWLHLEGPRGCQEYSRRLVGKGLFGNGWIPPQKTIRYLNVSIYQPWHRSIQEKILEDVQRYEYINMNI